MEKPDNIPATLLITEEKLQDITKISSFELTGHDIDIHGNAELNKTLTDIRLLTIDKLLDDNSDLDHVAYEKTDTGYLLAVHGTSANVGRWLEPGGENTFSFESFPSLSLDVNVRSCVLEKTERLRT